MTNAHPWRRRWPGGSPIPQRRCWRGCRSCHRRAAAVSSSCRCIQLGRLRLRRRCGACGCGGVRSCRLGRNSRLRCPDSRDGQRVFRRRPAVRRVRRCGALGGTSIGDRVTHVGVAEHRPCVVCGAWLGEASVFSQHHCGVGVPLPGNTVTRTGVSSTLLATHGPRNKDNTSREASQAWPQHRTFTTTASLPWGRCTSISTSPQITRVAQDLRG